VRKKDEKKSNISMGISWKEYNKKLIWFGEMG
jgi:hypothetical protein